MKLTTYAARFYHVNVVEGADLCIVNPAEGEQHVELYEKSGDPGESIGWFIMLPNCDQYQWRNVYGNVASGTVYTEEGLKAALKAGAFYPY